jgi:hypothetical protein
MKAPSAVIAVLLCTVVPAKSDDEKGRPNPYFKGITIVSYQAFAKTEKSPCAIDMNSWNTAIDFIANQSVKLKLIRDRDRREQEEQLRDAATKASDNYKRLFTDDKAAQTAKKQHDEAWNRYDKYASIPTLSFHIDTLDLVNGCAGSVVAKVDVVLEAAMIKPTGKTMYTPIVTIWGNGIQMSDGLDTFSSLAIRTSEQILKKLVNDWTQAQED